MENGGILSKTLEEKSYPLGDKDNDARQTNEEQKKQWTENFSKVLDWPVPTVKLIIAGVIHQQ